MNRSEFLKTVTSGVGGIFAFPWLVNAISKDQELARSLFGNDFHWGVSTSALQSEGAWNIDGKGESIWDRFSHTGSHIDDHSNADVSCDFYHLYQKDLTLLKELHLNDFRFSTAWSRILPNGTGNVNQKGIDFYNKVIDTCLSLGIKPWVTLYHWDLPQELEDKGGWTNRDILNWFSEYADICSRKFGDRVKDWIVINEPAAFTTLGYLTGLHAPGHRSIGKFMAAVHHATLCQSIGGDIIRNNVPKAHIGTALSCSYVEPYKHIPRYEKAAKRIDVLLNRLFIEPLLGLGYPVKDLPFLRKLEKYQLPGDEEKVKFNFDFIGLQNYFRVIGKPGLIPFIWASQKKPDRKTAELTDTGWEVWPKGIYDSIMQFSKYPIKEIIITENGAAYQDILSADTVKDDKRVAYFKEYLAYVLKAKQDGANVTGYFAWTFVDNFEWTFGYGPRFGIVYNDFKTQHRIVKNSGLWFREFLK